MAAEKTSSIKSVKKWFYALMGKMPPVEEQKSTDAEVYEEPKEDSITSDINAFKGFAKKGVDITRGALNPFGQKGKASAEDVTKVIKSSLDKRFVKTLIRSFLIIFFTIILIYIAIYLFSTLKREVRTAEENTTPPTPVPFETYKYSLYADDPEVLVLEEEVNILEKELARENIKEDGINPPLLDWDISF